MSGTLAAIFSFEASKKWIMREGPKGTSVIGSGAPIAMGLKKLRGLRKGLLEGGFEKWDGAKSSISAIGERIWIPAESLPGAPQSRFPGILSLPLRPALPRAFQRLKHS